MHRLIIAGLVLALSVPSAAMQGESLVSAGGDLTYADLADLALSSPVVAHVRVKRAILLKGDDAATVPPDRARYYVEAEVVSLIRAPRALPAEVRYLTDLPRIPGERAPKLEKKSEHLLFAATVPGRPDELRLIARDAQIGFTPQRADRARAILREASAADAAPRITGVGRAFHVPGTLPGEGETQLFLLAADGRPVSISVLRRPGQRPRWAVALGEIIDESAEAPQPETLLWYRLACGLPRGLPPRSLAEAEPAEAQAIREDYALVLRSLGPCVRTRTTG